MLKKDYPIGERKKEKKKERIGASSKTLRRLISCYKLESFSKNTVCAYISTITLTSSEIASTEKF